MNWIFQASEKYFDIASALRDLDEITWILTRYSQEYAKGDNVAVWKSGKNAGIYALGRISALIVAGSSRPNPGRYWTKLTEYDRTFIGKPHAVVAIDKRLVERPLLRTEIVNNPRLQEMAILRSAIGTNFRLTDGEWSEIERLASRQNKIGAFMEGGS